jgi:predicted ATP-binding protein involved in virulence
MHWDAEEDSWGWLSSVPDFQTRGVASYEALARIMGINPIPEVEEAQWIADYTAAIENGTHDDAQGRALREKLLAFYGADHPVMLDADRLIRFQSFKLRKQMANKD